MKEKYQAGIVAGFSTYLIVFLISWGIIGCMYWQHYINTTILGTFSELTMPKGIEMRYLLLSVGYGALWGSLISILPSAVAYGLAYKYWC